MDEKKLLAPNHIDAMDWAAFLAAIVVVVGIGLYFA